MQIQILNKRKQDQNRGQKYIKGKINKQINKPIGLNKTLKSNCFGLDMKKFLIDINPFTLKNPIDFDNRLHFDLIQ